MRHGLTVIILTRNEKKNIEDCIASVKFADDIIIVDSGSEDNTRDIAQKCGARVFLKPFENFAAQRNFGLSKVETDWVFYLDADERVLPEIREEILKAVNLNERFSYRVQRRQIIFGERVNYGGHGPDYVARLFPTDAIKWEGIVHEGVVTDLESKTIAGGPVWIFFKLARTSVKFSANSLLIIASNSERIFVSLATTTN